MKSIKYIFLFITLFSSIRCQKLEENPASIVSESNYYQTTDQVVSVFTASMNNLWNIWTKYSYRAEGVLKNDDQMYYANKLIITDNWGSSLWTAHYSSIYNLNVVIRKLNAGVSTISDADTRELLAEAKFLRGFNYFMLVRMWGDLPLYIDSIEDPTTAMLSRSPVKEIYKLITSDFTSAIAGVPEIRDASVQGRPTADAARGLLAKAYLTMATYPINDAQYYDSATVYSKAVITGGRYSLVPDINNVFTLETKYGPENLWSFISNTADQSSSGKQWSNYYGWGVNSVMPQFATSFPEQPRKNAYLDLTYNGQTYIQLGLRPGIRKFIYDRSTDDLNVFSGVINIPIIRLADIYLIYAEAINRVNGGPTSDAVGYVNQIVNRANGNVVNSADPLATTSLSMSDFETKVLQERSWELCFEFDRWFDIIRKRILKDVTPTEYLPNYNDRDYLFPIPLQDLRLNTNLSQNPGY